MPYPYSCTVVIGATSGIGASLADTILRETDGTVIAAGRRKERLDKWVEGHGAGGSGAAAKVSGEVVDLTDLESLEGFAKRVLATHPDLDCIILNSGIQNTLDFTKAASMDLKDVDTELTTNYVSYIHLIKHFLPHLQDVKRPAGIVTVSSGLAMVPLPSVPTYCASKAALHSLTMSLRHQLKAGGYDHLKVIEILPPLVQTELQGTTGHVDSSRGMPLAEFTAEAWAGLSSGAENVPVGQARSRWAYLEERRMKAFDFFVRMFAGEKVGSPPWEGAGP